MWEYYKKNKETLPGWIRGQREKVINELMTGSDVSKTFANVTLEEKADSSCYQPAARIARHAALIPAVIERPRLMCALTVSPRSLIGQRRSLCLNL
jgi:hypothetical protein